MNKFLLSTRKNRQALIRSIFSVAITLAVCFVLCVPTFAENTTSTSTSGTEALNKAKSLLSQAAGVGGGLWAVWGLVQLGIAIKDHNGPGMQGAIWQLVGGAVIIAASTVISGLNLNMT